MKRTYRRRIRLNITNILGAIALIALVILFVNLASPEVQAADHLENSIGNIRYEYVNMRSKPTTNSQIVDVIYEGATVTFTGNYIEYFLDDVYPVWVEVEYDGHIGWIVVESVSGFSMRG